MPRCILLSDWVFQLVEDEEVIGTLIESNERIIAALQSYDKVGLHDVPFTHYPFTLSSSPNRM